MVAERTPIYCEAANAEEEEAEVQPSFRGTQRPRCRKIGTSAVLASVVLVALFGLVALSLRRQPQRQAAPIQGKSLFLAEEGASGKCLGVSGVKVAESSGVKSEWPACSAKWSEDCRDTGCCSDWGMKCYEKNHNWASCKASCEAVDERNETWTCAELGPPVPRTADSCFASCGGSKTCKQAIFSSDAGGACSHSKEAQTRIVWAADSFEVAYCGQGDLQGLVDKVNSQMPFLLPQSPMQNCSWGGEDCAETKCCNDVFCDKDFTGCYGYSCYRKTEYFSGCSLNAPPADWEGTWLGGAKEHRTVPPAGSKVQVQGTSLYCFAVISWNAPAPKPFWAPERDLANNIKDNGVSLMQCDGHDFYDGIETPKAEWGSFSNIDAFLQVWKAVKDKGEYRNHDWTVKVDADAVFFPARLKMHLDKLRTPKGARVYIENTWYRFKFMGALEVVTTQALEVFLARSQECIRGEHAGGEDFFMKGCMDALGIDHQSDFELLHDKYAGQDAPCTDGWTVAYHYHKKVISWNWCYNEAVCGGAWKSCDAGLAVEYLPV